MNYGKLYWILNECIFLELAGRTNWEHARVDQFIELVEDMFQDLVKTFFETDETKKVRKIFRLG